MEHHSWVKFLLIQTATTIYYCGEEIEECRDNRSEGEWSGIGGEERAECPVLS